MSLVGFALTAAGLIYAILQIRKTQSAAEAAKEAAFSALEESRNAIRRFAASNAHRFIAEVKIYVTNQEWQKAVLRLNDLADQAALLAWLDQTWAPLVNELRTWAAICTAHTVGSKAKFPSRRWTDFSVTLQAKIDRYHGPFTEAGNE